MKRTDITELFPDATAEQINKLMDLNGADINKAKGDLDALKEQLSSVQTELDKHKSAATGDALKDATDRANALQAELDKLTKANDLRTMREKVSSETKVPATLLTGETEEACAEQAKAILAFAQPNGYPNIRDGGEVHNPTTPKTRDKFAEWASENL